MSQHKTLESDPSSSGNSDVPSASLEQFARFVLTQIEIYYQSDEGQKDLASWREGHESSNSPT